MPPKVYPALPIAGGAGPIIAPFQFVLSGEDNLRIVSFNSVTSVRLAIQGLRFDATGRAHAFGFTHVPNTDRTRAAENFALGAGALEHLTVAVEGAAPLVGQTYVMVQIIRGFTGATIVLGTLLAGYVTAGQALGWPGSPMQRSTDGLPPIRSFALTDPAAGNDLTVTVPTGARWEVLSLVGVFTADATVTVRGCQFEATNGGVVVARTIALPTIAASESRLVVFQAGVQHPRSDFSGSAFGPIPQGLQLLAGSVVNIDTVNLQVGDDWSVPMITVREWFEAAA